MGFAPGNYFIQLLTFCQIAKNPCDSIPELDLDKNRDKRYYLDFNKNSLEMYYSD